MKPERKTERYKLMRKEDGHIVWANEVVWVEWDEHGRGKQSHKEPSLGFSLVMEPMYNGLTYVWLTTPIQEIVKQSPKRLLFKTRNSTYLLTDRWAGKLS